MQILHELLFQMSLEILLATYKFTCLPSANCKNKQVNLRDRWVRWQWPSGDSTKMGESSRSSFIRWTCSIFGRQIWIVDDLRLLILSSVPSGSLRANINIPAVKCGQKYLTFDFLVKYLLSVNEGWKVTTQKWLNDTAETKRHAKGKQRVFRRALLSEIS